MADLRLLLVTNLAVAGAAYAITDKQPVDTEVSYEGMTKITTKTVLAATVESLRNDKSVRVMSYKGTANVKAERRWLWLFHGHQMLSVPGIVSYHVDLSKMTDQDITFDEAKNVVTVRLPKVALGEVSLQPENATTVSGGILSWDDGEIDALQKLNFRHARRAMVAQAQQPALVDAAKRQARLSVASLFEIPLRIAGQPDVKVNAVFDDAA